MHFAELTPVEQRVLGCLIEKRWTTPEQYPLSLNSLRLACNQSTNRDPVTRYEESEVRDAGQRLSKYGLARLASGHNTRSTKYRHLAEEGLGLDREQLAVLCVLLLRGPQTPGELKQRSERMAPLPTLGDVERILAELGQRGYAVRLERRPGQKEDRFAQVLGGAVPAADADRSWASEPVPAGAERPPAVPPAPPASVLPASVPPAPVPASPSASTSEVADLRERVTALEADLAQLRTQLADLLS
ncbi:MAG: YceH family protein [Solirubrobacteraceae bacterium]